MKTKITISNIAWRIAIVGFAAFAFQNCDNVIFSNNKLDDPGTLVCDPLGGGGGSDPTEGIRAQLYYLKAGQPRYTNVADYMTMGTLAPLNLFFSQLNVPTQPWSDGFQTEAGEILENNEGDPLFEYFGLRFEARLKLAPGEAPGAYQLALLSDDGTVLEIKDGGSFSTLIDNDHNHPTKFKNATASVQMTEATRLPFRLSYYQGPRHHIALMLLWRPWPSGDVNDPQNNQLGNEMYFTADSQPKKPYQDLLTRGWKVLSPKNFALDENTPSNPCVKP